jgi:hypothetical protein
MKRKVILLGAALTVLNLQCSLFPDCDSDDVKPYFNVTGIAKLYIEVQTSSTRDVYKTLNTVAEEHILWFNTNFIANYYSAKPDLNYGLSFIASAIACSPTEPGYKGSDEKYQSISVKSDADFDLNHLAGSELKDLFRVPKKGGPAFISLEEYIKSNPRLISPSLLFKLDKHPKAEKNHSFTFRFELANGEIYVIESGEIKFQ